MGRAEEEEEEEEKTARKQKRNEMRPAAPFTSPMNWSTVAAIFRHEKARGWLFGGNKFNA